MTEYEVNTFKIDFDAITEVEVVDMWLDKLSRVLNGYMEERNGQEVQKHLTKRAEARIWMFVDPLLDKRLDLTTVKTRVKQHDRPVRVCS